MSTVEVFRHPDAAALADAVAARLITRLVERLADAGHAHLCLTGGGIGTAVLAAIAASPARDSVDWPRVDIWWGDERYLPGGLRRAQRDQCARGPAQPRARRPRSRPSDPGTRGARTPTSTRPPRPTPARSRPRPARRTTVPRPRWTSCCSASGPTPTSPRCSPGQPALHDDRPCVAVRGAPKPPPVRVTLTLPTINAAHEVWILASGSSKAGAVHLALAEGAGPFQVPAAGARGRDRTLFLLDEAAAAKLPAGMARPGA